MRADPWEWPGVCLAEAVRRLRALGPLTGGHRLPRESAIILPGMTELGRLLVVFGLALVAVGLALTLLPRLVLPRLPGDILIQRDGFTFYFPLVTSLLVSLILTLLLNLVFWVRR